MNVWNLVLFLCFLFGVVYSHSCPDSSGNQTDSVDRHTTDPRWRVLSGLEATAIYSLYAVSQHTVFLFHLELAIHFSNFAPIYVYLSLHAAVYFSSLLVALFINSCSALQRFREMADPPLVNTTDYQSTQDDTSTDQGLESLIDAVCKLVSFHELVSSTDGGSTLHAVLSANVEDSCNWVSVYILMLLMLQ